MNTDLKTTTSIQNRQVTIKVLTINGDKITQSFYKQLVEENVIDNITNRETKGPIWGWINLHTDCNTSKEHLHTIWEDKGQLKRFCIYRDDCKYLDYEQAKYNLERLICVYCGLLILNNRSNEFKCHKVTRLKLNKRAGYYESDNSRHEIRITFNNREIKIGSHLSDYSRLKEYHTSDWGKEEWQKIVDGVKWQKYFVQEIKNTNLWSLGDVHSKIIELMDIVDSLEEEWFHLYLTILDTGQIFI